MICVAGKMLPAPPTAASTETSPCYAEKCSEELGPAGSEKPCPPRKTARQPLQPVARTNLRLDLPPQGQRKPLPKPLLHLNPHRPLPKSTRPPSAARPRPVAPCARPPATSPKSASPAASPSTSPSASRAAPSSSSPSQRPAPRPRGSSNLVSAQVAQLSPRHGPAKPRPRPPPRKKTASPTPPLPPRRVGSRPKSASNPSSPFQARKQHTRKPSYLLSPLHRVCEAATLGKSQSMASISSATNRAASMMIRFRSTADRDSTLNRSCVSSELGDSGKMPVTFHTSSAPTSPVLPEGTKSRTAGLAAMPLAQSEFCNAESAVSDGIPWSEEMFSPNKNKSAKTSSPQQATHSATAHAAAPKEASEEAKHFQKLSQEDVQEWLKEQQFGQDVCSAFSGFEGGDVLELSRQDLIDLLGTSAGLRMHVRLKRMMKKPNSASIIL
eukprot:g68843.t1